jgi:hypothetical protein
VIFSRVNRLARIKVPQSAASVTFFVLAFCNRIGRSGFDRKRFAKFVSFAKNTDRIATESTHFGT